MGTVPLEWVRERGACTWKPKTTPPAQAFLVALGGTALYLRVVPLQTEGQTPGTFGQCLLPEPTLHTLQLTCSLAL